MLWDSLRVDSTDFRTRGNENAASHSQRSSRGYEIPNIRLLKKAANEAAGERKPQAYPLGYVEDFVEQRTKLAAFFSGLSEDFSILTRMHPRLIGKAQGGAVWIAGVVEVDAIVPADGFHCDFKGNGLWV